MHFLVVVGCGKQLAKQENRVGEFCSWWRAQPGGGSPFFLPSPPQTFFAVPDKFADHFSVLLIARASTVLPERGNSKRQSPAPFRHHQPERKGECGRAVGI